MEVRKGYKQTEVGVIPEDWDVKKFGEVASIRKQKFSPQSVSTPLFCIELDNIEQGSGVLIGDREITNIVSMKSVFCEGDVLFGKLRAYLRKYWLADKGGLCSTEIWPLIAISSLIKKEYLFQIVQTDKFIEVASMAYGTHMPRTDWSIVKNYSIPLPSLPEQESIAEALSDADAFIESIERLLAKKRQIKQGAMSELLTGRRRLVESGEWEGKRLGEVAEIKTGKKNNEDKVEDGIYPFFVRSQTVERINSYSFDGEAILIPGEGGIGNILHYINGKFDYHQRVYRISNFAEDICGKFIYYMMVQSFGQHAMRNTVKATVDSLRLPTFQEFEFVSPPTLEEQTAIAEILSEMDGEIAALEEKLVKARQVKAGMMGALLGGKIRLLSAQR